MSQQEGRESKKDDPNNVAADPFLASMTFASSSGGLLRDCDCDECESLPVAIANAVQRHKRLKLMSMPIKRSQGRTLIKRHHDNKVSVYKWTLPLNAEPLVEFGNSHRLVWVQRLPERSIIKSIGTGIIGSSAEENERTVIDWKADKVYLVPANGGKAVGWMHCAKNESSKEESTSSEPSGPIVMYMAKIPVEDLERHEDDSKQPNEQETHWTERVKAICRRALERDSTSEPIKEKDTDLLKECIR